MLLNVYFYMIYIRLVTFRDETNALKVLKPMFSRWTMQPFINKLKLSNQEDLKLSNQEDLKLSNQEDLKLSNQEDERPVAD